MQASIHTRLFGLQSRRALGNAEGHQQLECRLVPIRRREPAIRSTVNDDSAELLKIDRYSLLDGIGLGANMLAHAAARGGVHAARGITPFGAVDRSGSRSIRLKSSLPTSRVRPPPHVR
jgi:hypothetical protein